VPAGDHRFFTPVRANGSHGESSAALAKTELVGKTVGMALARAAGAIAQFFKRSQ
jgi:hypothetical protein